MIIPNVWKNVPNHQPEIKSPRSPVIDNCFLHSAIPKRRVCEVHVPQALGTVKGKSVAWLVAGTAAAEFQHYHLHSMRVYIYIIMYQQKYMYISRKDML